MNHTKDYQFAHTPNELGPPPEPNDPFTPKEKVLILVFCAIIVSILVTAIAWHNGWLSQPSPELKEIRDKKQAVSDKIDSTVVHIRNKARTSVHKQRELTEDYKAFVPVTVETDSANEAFYLRDSIKKYN